MAYILTGHQFPERKTLVQKYASKYHCLFLNIRYLFLCISKGKVCRKSMILHTFLFIYVCSIDVCVCVCVHFMVVLEIELQCFVYLSYFLCCIYSYVKHLFHADCPFCEFLLFWMFCCMCKHNKSEKSSVKK